MLNVMKVLLCIALLVAPLASSSTNAQGISLDVDGDHVCTRTESYSSTFISSYSEYYHIMLRGFCWEIFQWPPFWCTELNLNHITKYRQEFKDEYRSVRECCDGYLYEEPDNYCYPCSMNKWGHNCNNDCFCLNGTTCDPFDGNCTCSAGYTGSDCGDTCTWNKYGPGCLFDCQCENGAACDPVTGACNCTTGFRDPLCVERCPEGTYGYGCNQTCQCQHNATCNHIDGRCFCSTGWQGVNCAEPCPAYHFGPGCNETCSCVNAQSCDRFTGSCKCDIGYIGQTCSERCVNGTFGRNCSLTCDYCVEATGCTIVEGKCQCKPNFYGVLCNSPCENGFWGDTCKERCSCENEGSCHPTTGECICPPGFTGAHCENWDTKDSGDFSWLILIAVGMIFLVPCIVIYIHVKMQKQSGYDII
ncbi:uncharacterized protein [Apostichopus japonicus]|uniref:uncharacterized protein isoform X2 n=1 Tax=Stichopus japonicus TaxID=307972 RepID=UPI003AB8F72A